MRMGLMAVRPTVRMVGGSDSGQPVRLDMSRRRHQRADQHDREHPETQTDHQPVALSLQWRLAAHVMLWRLKSGGL